MSHVHLSVSKVIWTVLEFGGDVEHRQKNKTIYILLQIWISLLKITRKQRFAGLVL